MKRTKRTTRDKKYKKIKKDERDEKDKKSGNIGKQKLCNEFRSRIIDLIKEWMYTFPYVGECN